MQDDRKFFDVSRPRPTSPPPTSRPIIVGQGPPMNDPMIREPQEELPQPAAPNLTDVSAPHEASPSLTPSPPQDTQLPPPGSVVTPATPQPSVDLPLTPEPQTPVQFPAGTPAYSHKPRLWVWVLIFLVLLAAIYAVIDYKTDWKLPFEIFSSSQVEQTDSQAAPSEPELPAGFSEYQPTGTQIKFAYPTAWGTPTTTAEPGFSQRGTGKQSDGAYAYIVRFADNADIEIAITTSRYLPPQRTALYYDYLQWCIGTHDGKVYRQTLHFTTVNGVDTPGTVACDDGPLVDTSKVNDAVIVQGDVYTANLSDAAVPVLRVKDAKMTSGDDIETLLSTVAGAD